MVLWKETKLLESQNPHISHESPWNILTVKEFLHTKNKMSPACLDSMGKSFINKFEWQITIWRLATSKYFPVSIFQSCLWLNQKMKNVNSVSKSNHKALFEIC